MNHLQKILFLIFLSSTMLENSNAQNFAGADRKFNNLQYSKAIPEYVKGLQKDSTNSNAWMKLADCYRLTNQPEMAEKCYSMVMKDQQTPAIYKFYYAQTLLINGNYEQAQNWFIEYFNSNPDDEAGRDYMNAMLYKQKLVQDSNRFIIRKININSGNADFGAVQYKDGILFASSRAKNDFKKNKIDPWTAKPFVSVYYAKGIEETFSEPELFIPAAKLNSNYGPVAYNKNTGEIYFTTNNPDEPEISTVSHKTENLCIYSMKMENGKFSRPVAFEYNSRDYSVAHPYLNADGTLLYFSSDMNGTFGGMDIWVCHRDNNHWSKPENLGKSVNTRENEIYPTVGDDGALYFSSTGHPGIGGLDIFSTYFNGERYVEPTNLGAPINSSDDDFALHYNIGTNSGYLSSNRYHQKENDDILSIRSNMVPLMGFIVDKLTNEPCLGCTVYLNKDGDNVGVLKTDRYGRFRSSVIPEKKYELVSTNKDYVNDTINFTANASNMTGDSLALNIEIENAYAPNTILRWNKILYDVNKYNIREDAATELNRLVDLMNSHPCLKIELSAHTDCRGSDKYNMTLSKNRAEAAVQYCISRGIDPYRLVAQGYGETKPIINCDCRENVTEGCPEEEHQVNRRTEIKVLE